MGRLGSLSLQEEKGMNKPKSALKIPKQWNLLLTMKMDVSTSITLK